MQISGVLYAQPTILWYSVQKTLASLTSSDTQFSFPNSARPLGPTWVSSLAVAAWKFIHSINWDNSLYDVQCLKTIVLFFFCLFFSCFRWVCRNSSFYFTLNRKESILIVSDVKISHLIPPQYETIIYWNYLVL